MGDRMKSWFVFGYMSWSGESKPASYTANCKTWKPLWFGFWYLSKTKCPVTGADVW